MAIWAREPKNTFTPAPEGLLAAVCVDVVDLGLVHDEFGSKYKVQIRWAIEELDPETGKPLLVVRKFTNSLHKKAGLRQALEMWRGRAFTAEELAGFDLEKLISAPCQVQVVHNVSAKGETFANVQAIIPLGRGMTKLAIPADYVRVKDREQTHGAADANNKIAEDDDCPF